MSRNPELEALLQAKFDKDTCSDDQIAIHRERFESLLNRALQKARGVTREALEESLREPYREFRRVRIQDERARLSRLR